MQWIECYYTMSIWHGVGMQEKLLRQGRERKLHQSLVSSQAPSFLDSVGATWSLTENVFGKKREESQSRAMESQRVPLH